MSWSVILSLPGLSSGYSPVLFTLLFSGCSVPPFMYQGREGGTLGTRSLLVVLSTSFGASDSVSLIFSFVFLLMPLLPGVFRVANILMKRRRPLVKQVITKKSRLAQARGIVGEDTNLKYKTIRPAVHIEYYSAVQSL